jgi:hypothetical protein
MTTSSSNTNTTTTSSNYNNKSNEAPIRSPITPFRPMPPREFSLKRLGNENSGIMGRVLPTLPGNKKSEVVVNNSVNNNNNNSNNNVGGIDGVNGGQGNRDGGGSAGAGQLQRRRMFNTVNQDNTNTNLNTNNNNNNNSSSNHERTHSNIAKDDDEHEEDHDQQTIYSTTPHSVCYSMGRISEEESTMCSGFSAGLEKSFLMGGGATGGGSSSKGSAGSKGSSGNGNGGGSSGRETCQSLHSVSELLRWQGELEGGGGELSLAVKEAIQHYSAQYNEQVFGTDQLQQQQASLSPQSNLQQMQRQRQWQAPMPPNQSLSPNFYNPIHKQRPDSSPGNKNGSSPRSPSQREEDNKLLKNASSGTNTSSDADHISTVDLAMIQKTMSQMTSMMEELQTSNAEMRKTCAEVQQSNAEMQKSNAELQKSNAELLQTIHRQRDRIQSLEETTLSLQSECIALRDLIESIQSPPVTTPVK